MEYGRHNEEYYKKMLELQEQLRRSEEQRLKLEEKFNEMMQRTRDAEHDRLRLMRYKYHKFLDEDKIRQERNENILQALDRIESRAKMLEAKTNRFKVFRKQYESYIKRIYQSKTEQQPPLQNISSTQLDCSYTQSNVRKKLFPDLPTTNENVEGKLAMLEQYLRDNFENFPPDNTNSQRNINTTSRIPNENEHLQNQNTYKYERKQTYFEPDSDSKESQEIFDDIHYPKPPSKSELLGNTIEKELERLKHKEQVKQISFRDENKDKIEFKQPEEVIQDYKDLVSKSEEKFGLRNDSPVRNKINIVDKEIEKPNIYDNTTKTVNIEELKNITTVPEKSLNIEENVDSESEIIKNYKNMVKSLKEELPPIDNNNMNVPVSLSVENNVDVENVSEISKNDDNSEHTEPPADISLNFSSHKSDEFPMEPIISIPNNNIEDSVNNLNQNGTTNENSLDESTVKEQIPDNLEKESSEEVKPSNPDENQVYEEYESQNQPEIEEIQHVYQPETEQMFEEQSKTEGNEHVSQEQLETEENQQMYQPEQSVNQVYSEEYNNQQLDYQQESYNIQDNAADGALYQDPNQTEYLENYDVSQQNVVQQQEYQEEYDTLQQDPNYQEGYDQQYYAQQDQTGQEYDQQYVEGYEQYQQEQYDQQQSDYIQEQPLQQTYDTNMYNNDQNQYEEYDQQYTQQEQIPENLYKSEQEYIQGEQNIDKQYENQEYQPQTQDYPENYIQEENVGNDQEVSNVISSESTEKSSSLHLNDSVDINPPIIEKTLPNITDMLETDTESQSIKQDTKVSNDSDFDFSKS